MLPARWTQYLTSQEPLPNSAEEGHSKPHPEDPSLTFESGYMRNPNGPGEVPFEEVWKDIDASGQRVIVLEREGGQGWMIQIGMRCLGLIVQNSDSAKDVKVWWGVWENGWKTVHEIGDCNEMTGMLSSPEETLGNQWIRDAWVSTALKRWIVREREGS